MTWVAVAIGGASLVGGILSSNAASSAASTQAGSARDANQLQWNMFQQQQQNQAPWQQVGSAAVGQLGSLMGVSSPQSSSQSPGFGSMAQPFSMSDFQQDPGAQFRLDLANKALERSGAAKGMALSGAQLQGLSDYNQGQASQEYQNAYNRFMTNRTTQFGELSNLAGLGQSSTSQVGNMGMQTAGQMGQNTIGAGNAQAAGTVGQANAYTNAINTGMNGWNQYNMLNNMGNYGNYSITGTPGSSSPNFGNNWGQPVSTVPIG